MGGGGGGGWEEEIGGEWVWRRQGWEGGERVVGWVKGWWGGGVIAGIPVFITSGIIFSCLVIFKALCSTPLPSLEGNLKTYIFDFSQCSSGTNR